MHDFLTGNNISGNYDLPPHGVLVLPTGEYLETLTINQPVHLESQGGPARIGTRG